MKSSKLIIRIVLALVLASIILPVIVTSLYSYPAADDFAAVNSWTNRTQNGFVYVFTNMIHDCMTWQGTYFGNLIAGLPIYHFAGIVGLRMMMLVVSVLFFVATIFMGYEAIRWLNPNDDRLSCWEQTMALSIPFLLYVLGGNKLDEIFCWYIGATVYTIPLFVGMFGIAVCFVYESNKKISMLIVSSILMFLGAGGALCISAIFCAITLFVVLYDCIVERLFTKSSIIFGVTLLGTLINAGSPGNFKRHSYIDSEVRIGRCLWMTINRIHAIVARDFQDGLLWFVVIVGLAFGICVLAKSCKKFTLPGLVMLYAYITVILVDFPVVLGYSSDNLESRCAFVERFFVAIAIMMVAIYWGAWGAKYFNLKMTAELTVVIIIILSINLSEYFDLDRLNDLTPYRIVWHMKDGDYSDEVRVQNSILAQLENADKGSDLVLAIPSYSNDEHWTNLKTIEMSYDSEFWVNGTVAEMYGLNSVSVAKN